MEISRLAGAGLLTASLAAGVAASSNLVDIRGSGRTELSSAPVVGTLRGVGDTGAFSIGAVNTPVKMDRLIGGAFRGDIPITHPRGASENSHLEVQLFDREKKPLDVLLDVNGSGRQDWDNRSKMYELVSFSIKLKQGKLASSPQGACSRLGYFESACAVLLNSRIDHGDWTGLLPAEGLLVLTSSSTVSNPKIETKEGGTAKGPKQKKPARGSTNEVRNNDIDKRDAKSNLADQKWDLTLNNPLPSRVDIGVLEGSLVLALFATLVAALRLLLSRYSGLAAPVGEVSFDFSRSWGTNLGIGATILSLLTGGTVLLQGQYSNYITTYLLLAGLFGTFIPLGGTLYGLIRPDGAVGNKHYVGWYLLSSGVVLWGAFGQLLVIGLLLREVELARTISVQAVDLLIVMSKALMVFLVIYSFLTARGISKRNLKPDPKTPEAAAAPAAPLPMI